MLNLFINNINNNYDKVVVTNDNIEKLCNEINELLCVYFKYFTHACTQQYLNLLKRDDQHSEMINLLMMDIYVYFINKKIIYAYDINDVIDQKIYDSQKTTILSLITYINNLSDYFKIFDFDKLTIDNFIDFKKYLMKNEYKFQVIDEITNTIEKENIKITTYIKYLCKTYYDNKNLKQKETENTNILMLIKEIKNSNANILTILDSKTYVLTDMQILLLNSIYYDKISNDKIENIINFVIEQTKYHNLSKYNDKSHNLYFFIRKINVDIIIKFNLDNDYLLFNIFNEKFNLQCKDKTRNDDKLCDCNVNYFHIYVSGNKMSEQNLNKLINVTMLNKETMTFLQNMLYIEIKPNDKCYHATNTFNICGFVNDSRQLNIYNYQELNNKHKNILNDKILFWMTYFIGQIEYGGGWFTYKTPHTGPSSELNFGTILEFTVDTDFYILFVPPIFKDMFNDKENTEYYYGIKEDVKKVINQNIHTYNWSGSHTIYSLENTKDKIFDPIIETYYADMFTKKIISLGFKGYMSCDECEIFLNYDLQKNLNSYPKILMDKFYQENMSEYYPKFIDEANKQINEINNLFENKNKNDKIEKKPTIILNRDVKMTNEHFNVITDSISNKLEVNEFPNF
jgi:hypothetical protein